MKKPVAILAVLLAVAIIFAGVFGTQKNEVTKELTAVTAERDALTAKVAELEAAAETAAADLTAAKTTGDEAAAKVTELEAAAETAAADLAAAQAKNTELEAAAETAAADLAAAEAKVAELTAAADTAAADLAAAVEAKAAAEAKVAELETKVAEQEAKIKELEASTAPAATVTDPDLKAAGSYLKVMYKNSPETTMADYQVISKVVRGEKEYAIEWTADSETVKIIPGEYTTIDVDEKNPEEVLYTLTATIKNEAGESISVSFKHKVPAAMILEGLSYEEIVAAAYTLEDGLAMEEPQRLFGTVIRIPTPWSPDYKNITVDIQIGDLADQPIQCYRLSGEGAENLQIGDQITVEGIIKNYKGTIEFDKGCVLVGYGEIISQKGVLDAAYKLEDGMSMTAPTALAGEIVKIDTAWSEDYQNITVTIVCDGKTEQPIMCYRLTGEGAKDLAIGDKIAVYGMIKNYKGTIEFDKGCKLIPYEAAAQVRTVLTAYTLEDGLDMGEATLTGVISSIDTAYSPDYKNITVTIVVAGLEDNKIQCYRLSGEGADTLAVGDTITVTGTIKNYKGTIEFDKGCTFVK